MRDIAFALALLGALVPPGGETIASQQKQLSTLVNAKATGAYEAPDPPMGGTHHQAFKLTIIREGFVYESSEESGGVSYLERATIKWANVSGVGKPIKDGLSRWNTTLKFFKPIKLTRIDRFKTMQDEVSETSVVVIGFPQERDALECTRLVRSIAGMRQAATPYPRVRIEIDGVLLPQIKEYARIVDGHTYVRVCSVSEALAIKTLNANYEEVWIDRGDDHFRFPVGEYRLLFGDTVEPAPLAPFQIGDNVFFPLRFVAERMGASVEWDSKSRTVKIKKGA